MSNLTKKEIATLQALLAKAALDLETEAPATAEAPKKRGPGRPRKNPEATNAPVNNARAWNYDKATGVHTHCTGRMRLAKARNADGTLKTAGTNADGYPISVFMLTALVSGQWVSVKEYDGFGAAKIGAGHKFKALFGVKASATTEVQAVRAVQEDRRTLLDNAAKEAGFENYSHLRNVARGNVEFKGMSKEKADKIRGKINERFPYNAANNAVKAA